MFSKSKEIEIAQKMGKLEGQVELLEKENIELKEERQQFQKQINDLQDALIAVKNPDSYRMLMEDKYAQGWEEKIHNDIEEELGEEKSQVMRDYFKVSEANLFESPDDFFNIMDKLKRSQGVPQNGPVGDPNES